jgi:hypothetical protein
MDVISTNEKQETIARFESIAEQENHIVLE